MDGGPQQHPFALALAMQLVTKYRLRLADNQDSRLSELTGAFHLACAGWTGLDARLVGIWVADGDSAATAQAMRSRLESASQWAQVRMRDQVAARAQVELIVIGACDEISPITAVDNVTIGALRVDPTTGDTSELLPVSRALPSSREIAGICKTVARSGQAPTLAQVDLAERQVMTGSTAQHRANNLLSDRPIATYSLLGAIVFFFALQQLNLGGQTITGLWQLPTASVGATNWWTVVTYGFMHAGLTHIAFNGWALYVLGGLIERLYGRLAFISTFLAAVIGGALTSIATAQVSSAAGAAVVGASGGIFGLVGVLVMLGKVQGKGVPPQFSASMRSQMWFVVLINVGLGVLVPGISLTAHAGGFVTGVLIGLILPPRPEIGGGALSVPVRSLLVVIVAVSALALANGLFAYAGIFVPASVGA